MKAKLMKLIGSTSTFMTILATRVSAAGGGQGSAWSSDTGIQFDNGSKAGDIITKIAVFVKPFAAILIFASVLLIGFEIIMNRNKADDRMNSMTSLMWVGIGTLVIAFAALLTAFLFPSTN